jgi:hypothetical protein
MQPVVAGEIPPAVPERLAHNRILGCRAGRKLPVEACEEMKYRVVFHPSIFCKAGPSSIISRMALIGLRLVSQVT